MTFSFNSNNNVTINGTVHGNRNMDPYPNQWNHPDEPVLMAGPKPFLTEFGILHLVLQSCAPTPFFSRPYRVIKETASGTQVKMVACSTAFKF